MPATDEGGRGYTPAPVSKKPLGCLVEIAETLILTIVIFWLIQSFVAQPYRVEQQSMETTLLPDQYASLMADLRKLAEVLGRTIDR